MAPFFILSPFFFAGPPPVNFFEEKVKELVATEVMEKVEDLVKNGVEDKQESVRNYVQQQIERFELKFYAQRKETETETLKAKRVMTSRRDFSFLPKYGGKHEEFDEWKFKMVTFLSEKKLRKYC